MPLLEREEYIEQAYLFGLLNERQEQGGSLQELLLQAREEVLGTTRLPLAIEFLLSELKHAGVIGTAMARLGHYFSAFQTFIVLESEVEGGRFDMATAFRVLQNEAEYRSKEPTPQGTFLYQFEALCHNRLRYDPGLVAMSQDPIYSSDWQAWILTVRRQVGIVDLADLIYVRSEHYAALRRKKGQSDEEVPLLFGEKEGKIARSNRRKDPRYLFAALQRHLNYPTVPRRAVIDQSRVLIPQLTKRIERLEQRTRLIEEEQRGGIDLSRFMPKPES